MFLAKLKKSGFSLTELMVVVAIVGILASIGIPLYTKYIKRARTSEISYAFGKIKASEETWFSEIDSYKSLPQNPFNVPTSNSQKFCNDDSMTGCTSSAIKFTSSWGISGIGCRLSDYVYFQYALCAGSSTYVPTNCTDYLFNGYTDYPTTKGSFLQGANDSWYVIQARGDLDGDSTFSLFQTVIDSSILYKENDLE